jgi:hypothetical protein
MMDSGGYASGCAALSSPDAPQLGKLEHELFLLDLL